MEIIIVFRSPQEMCELFPTGKNQDPSITLLSDERFALGKDEQTTFIDLEGNMNLVAVQWSEVPQAIAQDSPYMLAVLSKTVEIRTDDPRLHIQGRHLVTMFLALDITSTCTIKIPWYVYTKGKELVPWCGNVFKGVKLLYSFGPCCGNVVLYS